MTRKLVDVSAGVLLRPDGCYLLGQRAQDTVYAGYWEFPGGKVEPPKRRRRPCVASWTRNSAFA